jgi:hypothetical protein
MSEQEQPENESIGKVHISLKAVHRAVRNILKNECQVDPKEIREKVREKAFELVRSEVIERLEAKGYGEIGLADWASRTIKSIAEKQLHDTVKAIVKELVYEQIHKQIMEVVGVIVEKGMEVQIGWHSRTVKVSTKEVEPK